MRNKKKVYELWLACKTQEKIAEAVGIPRTTIEEWTKNYDENLTVKESSKYNFQDDFDPPRYNVWKYKPDSSPPLEQGEILFWLCPYSAT